MRLLLLFAICPLLLFANINKQLHPAQAQPEGPWFTGPLLAPSSLVIPTGHWNFEVFVFSIANTGTYDRDWSAQKNQHVFLANSLEPIFQVGFAKIFDFEVAPTLYYSYTNGVGSWAFGDVLAELNIQIYASQSQWIPQVKVVLQETFPTGKYQKLDPKKQGTDAGGNGSFISSVGVVIGNRLHLGGVHYLSNRLFLEYTIPAPTHVKGFNTYGGDATTSAKIFPPRSFQIDLAFELTLSQNWVFALDILAVWAEGSDFSADPGLNVQFAPSPPGPPTPGAISFDTLIPTVQLGSLPLVQYSLAPAIEYNWNSHIGIIAGTWFTVAGKNAAQFVSGIFAANFYY